MLHLMAETISLRSFSTVWFWMALLAFWVSALRAPMGVPAGMVARARRGGDALAHLCALAAAQAQYRRAIWARWQLPMAAGASAGLAGLTVLAYGYAIELAQAVWFIAVPLALLAALDLRLAGKLMAAPDEWACLRMIIHFSFYRQLFGMAFIFFTVIFAFLHMAQNGFFR